MTERSLSAADVASLLGYVYLIAAEGTPYAKIGWVRRDVEKRLRLLQTGCPFPLRLVMVVRGSVADEHDLHWRHRAARFRGEWFHDSPSLRGSLSALAAKRKP